MNLGRFDELQSKRYFQLMWFVFIPIVVIVLLFLALFIDAYVFNGRYLNRSRATDVRLRRSLEAVLSQADRPFEAWDPIPQDWINDKMSIPLKDSRLDAIRMSVVRAIGDSNAFKQLTPETKSRIQEAIALLK